MIERERTALHGFTMQHQHASNKTNRSYSVLGHIRQRPIRFNRRCLIRLFLPALLQFFLLAGCGTTDPSTGAAPSRLPVIVAAATIPAPTLAPTKVLPID